MTLLRLFILLSILMAAGAPAQDESSQHVAVERDSKIYNFHCDSNTSLPSLNVTLQATSGSATVLKQQLDDIDDCSQASWVIEKIGKDDSSTLVLLNPGRSGVNMQCNAFLVTDESVSPAGYLPVSAERVGDFEYRSYSSETGSIWERTDTLQNGKFNVTNELRLVLSGSVCTNKTGEILSQEPCGARLVAARHGKPICVGYKAHKGKLLPRSACARLAEEMW